MMERIKRFFRRVLDGVWYVFRFILELIEMFT